VTDPDFAYLTTLGRRSGRPHTVELWYRRVGDTVWFLAGQRSDWVANVAASPAAQVRIGDGPTRAGTGRVVTGDGGGAAEARRLMAARYQGWTEGEPLSTWASTATAVAVDLSGD
jgi:deazaflavin-dependent oxidoreductase (nitroreductase family)